MSSVTMWGSALCTPCAPADTCLGAAMSCCLIHPFWCSSSSLLSLPVCQSVRRPVCQSVLAVHGSACTKRVGLPVRSATCLCCQFMWQRASPVHSTTRNQRVDLPVSSTICLHCQFVRQRDIEVSKPKRCYQSKRHTMRHTMAVALARCQSKCQTMAVAPTGSRPDPGRRSLRLW